MAFVRMCRHLAGGGGAFDLSLGFRATQEVARVRAHDVSQL